MASIQRRGERWRVQVRRHGLRPLSKTFDKHEEARRWAHKLEGRIAADDWLKSLEREIPDRAVEVQTRAG